MRTRTAPKTIRAQAEGPGPLAVDVMLGAAALLISAISVAVVISANSTQERLVRYPKAFALSQLRQIN